MKLKTTLGINWVGQYFRQLVHSTFCKNVSSSLTCGLSFYQIHYLQTSTLWLVWRLKSQRRSCEVICVPYLLRGILNKNSIKIDSIIKPPNLYSVKRILSRSFFLVCYGDLLFLHVRIKFIYGTAQKMFSIKDFFSKCDQICADLVTFTERKSVMKTWVFVQHGKIRTKKSLKLNKFCAVLFSS